MFDISLTLMTLDPDCGSTHLESVLSCQSMSCRRHYKACPILLLLVRKPLPACCSQVPGHHSTRCHRAKPTVFEWIAVCRKQLDLTWLLPIKMGSLQIFGCRVSFITAGKDVK